MPLVKGIANLIVALIRKLTDVLKILGLDICANIMVGDDMRRGIRDGQKKRSYAVNGLNHLKMKKISTKKKLSTNKSSTWGHVVTPAAHHQSHSENSIEPEPF
ncbi:hypothetical protein DEO72_LG5g2424 [Vigna unguiculata]|uniref:Uncharacterized protein n=1 Tax=Vigna unguiculata TaxID=3917 RepID=A0A4D6M1C4_VIGUN|nr:hypothetical protein DEO72_LG5g2424 [Vigna unguiculata]